MRKKAYQLFCFETMLFGFVQSTYFGPDTWEKRRSCEKKDGELFGENKTKQKDSFPVHEYCKLPIRHQELEESGRDRKSIKFEGKNRLQIRFLFARGLQT